MSRVVNIEKCFEKFNDTFSPKIIAELNEQHVKVARLEGDKVPWHIHDKEDEMFFVVDGILDILKKDTTITLNPGEFYIVRKGVEHKVIPHGHVKIILFEPAEIAHTGNVKSEITEESLDWLEF